MIASHAPQRRYRRPPPQTYLRRVLYRPQHSAPRNGLRDALANAYDAVREFLADARERMAAW